MKVFYWWATYALIITLAAVVVPLAVLLDPYIGGLCAGGFVVMGATWGVTGVQRKVLS